MRKLLNGLLQNIKYSEILAEHDFIKILREEAVKWACVLGESECREAALFELKKDLQFRSKNISAQGHFAQSEWKEWVYCKGLMSANYTIWHNVLEEWEATLNDIFLEYLTCSEDSEIINHFLLAQDIPWKVERKNTYYNILLLIITKHAGNHLVCTFIFEHFRIITITPFLKEEIMKVIILIVMITHQDNVDQLDKILEFVKYKLKEERLADAVHNKIAMRKQEYERRVVRYGSLL